MRNEQEFNDRRKEGLKWIASIFIIITGLALFETDTAMGVILIFVGVFILPFVQNFIDKKADFTTSAKYLIVLGGIALAFYAGYNNQLNEKNQADELIEQSITAISNNKLEEANALLNEAEELYRGSDNKAVEIQRMLDNANSRTFIKNSLGELSEQEFEELKNGTLSAKIIPNEAVNQVLLTNMREQSNLRADYLEEAEERREQARIAAREEKIEDQFSAWDGSHRKLEKYIKENMHDPDSYEHVETRYSDNDNYLYVITTFRGNNAFGGKVKNSVSARVSIENGDILEILSN
ncbi:MAG: hypothetical protein WD607_10000 [Candidatus Paceibacterota bacterium]